ncbi:uncharacterized protein [Prorops nasuta]|uniref:uncharacterized protein n=1 Tax=Prorops nasuta TaxID=863751 RepID=UPI0034CFFB8F
MSLSKIETNDNYYLPHHAVIKKNSLTTKVKVVFDASCRSDKGISLNEVLLTGPTIQDKLFEHILRIRLHKYIVTADIEKMYRQILVDPQDRHYQRILWWHQNKIETFELNTVTFRISSAPFLAIRTLKQLANDEGHRFPVAAEILRRDLYVDDLLTGADSVDEIIRLRDELIELLKLGGFNIRKWSSNHPQAVEFPNEKITDIEFLKDDSPVKKMLGVLWDATNDQFLYTVKTIDLKKRVTKRMILSEIAKIFDPLGLMGPIVFTAKLLMQECWRLKISWDESFNMSLFNKWITFAEQLKSLDNMSVQRYLFIDKAINFELHGFCDASKLGYGACLYIKSNDNENKSKIQLLCSKSRIAPLKEISIPKMELNGAVLLVSLFKEVRNVFKFQPSKIIFWCDSTIVLYWLKKSPNILKVYEANRVIKIQELDNIVEWRHVRSNDNPADWLSRGQTPNELRKNKLWFKGPLWLQKNEHSWPTSVPIEFKNPPGLKKTIYLITQLKQDEIFSRVSSYSRLIRIVAYCYRLLKSNNFRGDLSTEEINLTEKRILKLVQSTNFSCEIRQLNKNKTTKGTKLETFDPFLNEDETHEKHYHAGIQSILYATRYRFWILDGRNQVRKVIRNCIRCIRHRAKPVMYKMGNLPKSRVETSTPFYHTGIDYFGPFFVKEKKFRNRNRVKVSGCVFICMASKAVHIEILSDLTTEAFIGALRRFIGRRAIPGHIYSDNGSNFVGANRKLCDVYVLLESDEHQNKLRTFCNNNRIIWHFNPPFSPHFGGLWEAAVKSFKHHFKRVIGVHLFTFEELCTFSTEIEAILNYRPLYPISSDPNDPMVLTPAHCLIGKSLTALPEIDVTSVPENCLTSWQLITKVRQDFWKKWQLEYLNELQRRNKWKFPGEELASGTIVVLIDKNQPCMQWELGRIIETCPGEDKIVRVVTVKTAKGLFKGNVKTLCPLLKG